MNFKKQNAVTILLLAYLIVVIALMIAKNISITPDRLVVFIFFAAVIVGQTKEFLRDWLPFLGLLLGYEVLRGFADNVGFGVHVSGLVNTERALFGFIPTERLQAVLYHPGIIHWYDSLAVVVYFLHFPLPLVVAFLLWIKDRSQFQKFVIALLVLSFSGFVTFLLFPAAPPWYADQKGLIHVHKIIDALIDKFGWSWHLSEFYQHLNPNPVAAIPSLHAAYPWLSFLALRRFSKKWAWLFFPYPFIVWFSVVYLGEHYAIDVIAGVIYAQVSLWIIYDFDKIKTRINPLLVKIKERKP